MSIIGNILMLFIVLHSGEVIGKTTYLQSTKGKSAKQNQGFDLSCPQN